MPKTRTTEDLRGKVKSDFPKDTLESALRVAEAIADKNGGQPLPPIELAQALGMSPGSSTYRAILSSSIRYGLTSGSYNSDRISLTALGSVIVEPTSSDQKVKGLIDAALYPTTFSKVFEFYRNKKLPDDAYFRNAATREFGIPREHADVCVEVFKANMALVGLIKHLATGDWLSGDVQPPIRAEVPAGNLVNSDQSAFVEPAESLPEQSPVSQSRTLQPQEKIRKVFITHGKNLAVVSQIKELLAFGGFVPVVAIEHETLSIPVYQKVFDDMKSCFAAIIHVANEEELLDREGSVHHKINENVLVEIGAALALFGNRLVLLVQKGVHLPSNLQGLYRCEYEGERLDYDATMKLLKAFSEFR